MKRTTILIIALLILALTACTGTEAVTEQIIDEPVVVEDTPTPAPVVAPIKGGIAPEFELESVKGKLVKLSDFSGKPVVINFWATWCPPCVHEMPILNAARADGAVFEVVAVNNMEQYFTVRDFANEMELAFPVLLDLGDDVRELYRIQSFPTTLFVDADGVIRNIHIGGLSPDMLDDYLAEIGAVE